MLVLGVASRAAGLAKAVYRRHNGAAGRMKLFGTATTDQRCGSAGAGSRHRRDAMSAMEAGSRQACL